MLRWFLFPALLAATPVAAQAPAPAAKADGPLILAFGDSLTAGYGLGRGLGFAPQLQDTLRRHGVKARVHDAGVSGDTTAGGRARIGWTLQRLGEKPTLAIVELGANDMLRGVDPAVTEANLDAILAELKKQGIPVLVAGMLAAPNLGPDYRRRYEAIFPSLARKYGADLYPFMLQGVVGNRALLLSDGVHPNFEGVKRIVTGMLPTVQRALAKTRA
ncbi:arylesterase [Sphingomonas astaxanthinifaciens]|uniref:Arylesterase n=1 Tax=Sphingomonas astaxanthinifaciens DSM 22298 TaxID=1123267 RepID=A0ABQ5Z5E5_9SPHN|nr:arylesterase [Sphingomonas astaxanthinifaciens]GLR47948.1 arylesterase [Sphingomonas astaxanthinifaciens DSM 22298]